MSEIPEDINLRVALLLADYRDSPDSQLHEAICEALWLERQDGQRTGWFNSIRKPSDGFRSKGTFSEREAAKLRPIAETLAMMDGNAFFVMGGEDFPDAWQQYLPEASAVYEANGGDHGWAGEASFARQFRDKP